MTESQISELKAVVDAWFREKGIPSAGVEVIIRIAPLRVILDGSSKSRTSRLVELSEEDWEAVLSLPMRKDLLELLVLLKERKNGGVFKEDISSRNLVNAAQCISNVFRRSKVPYRLVHHAGEGNYADGPYRIRLMS